MNVTILHIAWDIANIFSDQFKLYADLGREMHYHLDCDLFSTGYPLSNVLHRVKIVCSIYILS